MRWDGTGAKTDRRREALFGLACCVLAAPLLLAGPQLAADMTWPSQAGSQPGAHRFLALESFSCHGAPGLASICRSSLRDGLTETVNVFEFHLGPAPAPLDDDVGLGELSWPRRVTTEGALQRRSQRVAALSLVAAALGALVLGRVRRSRPTAPRAIAAPAVTLAA